MSKCELCCSREGVYDASVLADWFGRNAVNRDDYDFLVCAECLNGVEDAVKTAWGSKMKCNGQMQDEGVSCGSK